MFETSVVQERVAQRHYGLLSASFAVHSLVVIAVVAAGISSTSLPKDPPREFPVFFQAAPVPQPPPAAHVATTSQPAQHPAASSVPHAATAPATITTPATIPDTIPNVSATSNDANLTVGTSTGTDSTNVIGDPNSVDIGVGQPATSVTPVPETVFHPGGDVRAAVVLQRVEPQFPRAVLAARVGGTVVLRCIVDKNGEVRDAEVVTSSFGAFEAPALEALRKWRFAPGSFHGKPVDSWFELTIKFVAR
jgi:periplasmic protein TonB